MKRLILFIAFLFSINFIYAQTTQTDTKRLIVRDSIKLQTDWIRLTSPTNGQLLQRVNGRWVNATVSATGWDSIPFIPATGLLKAYSGAAVDYQTSIDGRYVLISDSVAVTGYVTRGDFNAAISGQTVFEITLPASTSIAGRVGGTIVYGEGTEDWILTGSIVPVDLLITHNMDRRPAYVTVFAITGTQEQLLFNTAAYNGITSNANNITIQSLATINKPIKIYIIFK